jgi:hypothetical protein
MAQKSLAPVPNATVVSNEDGTPQSLVVSPAEGLIVKNGSTGGLAVKLPCQPSQNVTVKTAVIGDPRLTVSAGASLTFTSGNWNTPQGVTLQSVAGQAGWFRVVVAPAGTDIPGFEEVGVHVLVS